jgi:hypothetical protein
MRYTVTSKHEFLKEGLVLENYIADEKDVYYTSRSCYGVAGYIEDRVLRWKGLGWVKEEGQDDTEVINIPIEGKFLDLNFATLGGEFKQRVHINAIIIAHQSNKVPEIFFDVNKVNNHYIGK